MAQEVVSTITIKTDNAVKSTKSLKAQIKELKEQLNQCTQGTEEYNRILQEVGQKQRTLTENTKRISEASTDFSNNVAYTGQALAGLSGGIQTVTGVMGLMGVEADKSSKLMTTMVSAMSITSGITALQNGYTAVRRLTEGLKTATAGASGFNKVLSLIKANPFMTVVTAVTLLIPLIAKLTQKTDDAKDSTEALGKINESNNKIIETESKTVGTVIGQYDALQIAYTKSANSLKDRKNILNQVNEKFKDYGVHLTNINELEKFFSGEGAEAFVKSVEKRAKAQALLSALTEAEAKLMEDEAKYTEEFKHNNPTASDAVYEDMQMQKKLIDNYKSQLTLMTSEIKSLFSSTTKTNTTTTKETDLQKAQKEYDEAQKLTEAQYKAKEFDQNTYYDNSINNIQNYINRLNKLKQTKEVQDAINFSTLNLKTLQNTRDEYNTDLDNAQLEKEAKAYIDGIQNAIDNVTKDETKQTNILYEWLGLNYSEENEKKVTEQIDKLHQQTLDKEKEYYTELLQNGDLSLEERTEFQNALTDIEAEQAQIRIETAKNESQKKLEAQQKFVENYTTISSALTSVMDSLTTGMDENTQEYKAIKIAEAIISTISGAVNAYMSAMKLPYPQNLIAGASSIATVLASGYAQIASLKKVSTSGSNSYTPNNVTVQTLSSNVTNTRQTTTNSDYDELNSKKSATKVYVVSSEITDMQNKQKVKVTNNTF